MDKFPAHIPASPRVQEKSTGQRTLHTKQSLPNLWLPPRYGPIPSHLNRPQPPQPTSPNPPRMHQNNKLDTDGLSPGKGNRTPLLTPPLTPASSRRTASSADDVVAGLEAMGVEDGSRFLLISNVPTQLSSDALQALFAPYSGEVKGMYVRLHESHGLVVLAFWDEGAAGKVRKDVDGSSVPEGTAADTRLSKDGEGAVVAARFVSADELRELIGHSTFIKEVETLGEVFIGLEGGWREGELGALRALFAGIGRVKAWDVRGEAIRAEYSDIRDAASALDLDGRTMFGTTLRVSRRDPDFPGEVNLSRRSSQAGLERRGSQASLAPSQSEGVGGSLRAVRFDGGRARSVSADRRQEPVGEPVGRRGSNYHLYDAVGKANGGGVGCGNEEVPERRGSVQEDVGNGQEHGQGSVYDFFRSGTGGETLYESYMPATATGYEGWNGYSMDQAHPAQQQWVEGYYYAPPPPPPPQRKYAYQEQRQQEYAEYASAAAYGYGMPGLGMGMGMGIDAMGMGMGYLRYPALDSLHLPTPQLISPVPAVRPEHNQVNLARIEEGLDTRTTVMIKNIPNKMSDRDLVEVIARVTPRRVDFLYLRMDFQNGCNVGYAFVNFITVQDLLVFAKAKLGVKWNMYSSEKVLQMSYANYQGKEALVEKFKNSCIMDEREEWRPKIFYSDGPNQGLPEPFPKPTHLRRKERSSHNRGALYVPGLHHGGERTRLENRGGGRDPSFYQPPFKRGRAPHLG